MYVIPCVLEQTIKIRNNLSVNKHRLLLWSDSTSGNNTGLTSSRSAEQSVATRHKPLYQPGFTYHKPQHSGHD